MTTSHRPGRLSRSPSGSSRRGQASVRGRRRPNDDTGSSLAEFSMMSVLLVFLLFAVLQVAIFFYVRTIVSSAAADGARYAANVGVDSAAGGERASQLVGHALSGSLARDVPCVGTVVVDPASGIATSEVRCEGRIRSIFFPIGSLVTISADAHSLREVP